MDQDLLLHIVERVLAREFRSRTALAQVLGKHPSWVTKFSKEVFRAGVLDKKAWAACFQTKRNGQRGRDKHQRQPGSGWKRVVANECLRQTLQAQLRRNSENRRKDQVEA